MTSSSSVGVFFQLTDYFSALPTTTQSSTGQSIGNLEQDSEQIDNDLSKISGGIHLSAIQQCTDRVLAAICDYGVTADPDTKDMTFIGGSYISLKGSTWSLGVPQMLTVEIWTRFSYPNPNSSPGTLFAFGTSSTYISFPAMLSTNYKEAERLYHISVVFNFKKGYTKVSTRLVFILNSLI